MDRVHLISILHSGDLLGYNLYLCYNVSMLLFRGVGLVSGGGMGGPFLWIFTGFLGWSP